MSLDLVVADVWKARVIGLGKREYHVILSRRFGLDFIADLYGVVTMIIGIDFRILRALVVLPLGRSMMARLNGQKHAPTRDLESLLIRRLTQTGKTARRLGIFALGQQGGAKRFAPEKAVLVVLGIDFS